MSSHWGSLLLFQVILEVKRYLVLHTMFLIAKFIWNIFQAHSSSLHLCVLVSSFEKLSSQWLIGGLFYVNFMIDQFSYLNIKSTGRNLIQDENDCCYACLEIPFTLLYTILDRKGNHFLYLELTPTNKWYLFHVPSLEQCISFTMNKSLNQKFSGLFHIP